MAPVLRPLRGSTSERAASSARSSSCRRQIVCANIIGPRLNPGEGRRVELRDSEISMTAANDPGA